MLEKPTEYQEVSAQQNEKTVYAEDINQIITNVEKLKGGQANEAPVSNIKDLHSSINELKERIDGLGNGESSQLPSSADKISFNNDNANLDFSSQYDFPQFKNKLKERYEIKLIADYSINNVSHIDEITDVYNLVLEKSENKYILKGNLNYNNTSQYTSSFNFYIISIDNNNDFGHIINEMLQFINEENNAKENEILIEGLNNFKYGFGFFYAIPIFQIKKQDNSNFSEKEYTININIKTDNIQNNQEFIPIASGMSGLSFLKLKNINGKAVITGETAKTSADSSFILFSHFTLENYFDIKTDNNDSYYTEAFDMIKSDKGRTVKYYIRKEITDGSELSSIYADIPITFYYLEIKHTDNSKIEYNEILTFNLTATKNADVPKIEKEKNIQNAIDILAAPYELNKLKKISNIIIENENFAVYDLYTYSRVYMIGNLLFTVFFPKEACVLSLINLNNTYINNEYQSMIYDFNALGLKNIKMNYPASNKVHAFCIEFTAESEEEQNTVNDLKEQFNNNSVLLFNKITFIAKDGFDNFDIMTDDVKEYIKSIEEQIQLRDV